MGPCTGATTSSSHPCSSWPCSASSCQPPRVWPGCSGDGGDASCSWEMGNSENKARWNLGWVKIFCTCISAEVNLELPWNACVDGQWELLAGGFCIDWNKAKVLVSGLLPLFSWLCVPSPSGPGARHGTVGRALGVVSGWHSGISPAWGCRRQEGAKPRPWLRIRAVPALQTLPCRCPQRWLLEGWGSHWEHRTCSALVQDTEIFPRRSFCAGRNNCSCRGRAV